MKNQLVAYLRRGARETEGTAKRSLLFPSRGGDMSFGPHNSQLVEALRAKVYTVWHMKSCRCSPSVNYKLQANSCSRGFSLVELMVAVALFAVVMLVSSSALIALIDANRKAQALQSVMNNLNVALDGMVRSIRMGSSYHCGPSGTITDPQDCLAGNTVLVFESVDGDPGDSTDQWVYQYDSATKRLYKSEQGGTSGTFYAVTAPEVQIDSLTYYVTGTASGDTTQPRVVIVIHGTAGAEKAKTRTSFNIQATATQRLLGL